MVVWEPIIHENSAHVLFWRVEYSPTPYHPSHPEGFGLTYQDRIIYSTSYQLMGDFFRIFVMLYTLYVYSKVDLIIPNRRTIFVKKLWLAIIFLLLLHNFALLPWITFSEIFIFLPVISFALIAYVGVFYPEGLLLSDIQIKRVHNLIGRYESTTNTSTNETMRTIVNYLKLLSETDLEQS